MRRRGSLVVLAALVCAVAGSAGAAERAPCPEPRAGAAYTREVMRALRSGRDVWGEQLVRSEAGPTYEGAKRKLAPLLYARGRGKTKLTDSGVYYLAFGVPAGDRGTSALMLHLADGGQVIRDRAGGAELDVRVGGERFGSCLARLEPARLAGGWLPVLQTRYGAYAQESFAWRARAGLASYLRVTPAARFTAGGRSVTAEHVRWTGGAPVAIDAAEYDAARRAHENYWRRRLAQGASIETPEQVVNDAARATLAQLLVHTWRYSLGNPYEQFSFPEGVDVAQVLTEYGYGGAGAAILRTSLTRKPTPYPQWKMGEKLLGSGWHFRLTRDRAQLARATPALRRYVRQLARAQERSGLLPRERYSSDIPDQVYSLHGQAVVWQGLQVVADAWSATGRAGDARAARRVASRLGPALRRAVARSQTRLADGSLFVPVALLGRERPYRFLTEARLGSYWNLVMPYALAWGPLDAAQRRGVLRYMLRHGSRLLGVVRAGAYALYRDPVHPVGGTDQVYGINVARFLADEGEADQLVLSLYGTLATALTEHTFVGGEAASVAPLDGRLYRAMYLPPNGATSAAYLETLRSVLVREHAGGLDLAWATPRAWLRPAGRIAVSGLPTRFGPLAYTVEAGADEVRAVVQVPSRARPRALRLRLRLPAGAEVRSVSVDGAAAPRSATVDLSGRRGRVEVVVGISRATP